MRARRQKVINEERFRELYLAGEPVADIAKAFDISVATAERKVRMWDLTGRHGEKRPPAPLSETDEMAQLIASKGKYRILAEIAQRQKLTMIQVLQRYHAATRRT